VSADTVTSPEQQGVMTLLNLARPSADGSGALPLQPGVDKLLEVMMRGMTNVRSENAAKTAAKDIASAPTPVIRTKTTVDPVTGRQLHDIHYEGVQFGDAQQEVQDAYDAPQQATAAVLAPSPQQQIDAYIQEEVKRRHLDAPGSGGVYPPDLQRKALDTFSGKYVAERKAGNGPIKALFNSAIMQALPDSLERSREDELARSSDTQRFDTALAYAKEELPVAAEADRQRRLNEEQQRADEISKRFEVRGIRSSIAKMNFADTANDQEAINRVADENGIDPANLQKWAVKRVVDKREADVEASRAKTVQLFRKDAKALGQYPTAQAAATALGVPMKKQEESAFNADYSAAREETVRTRQNEFLRVRSDARAADAAGRSADAAARAAARDTGKPVDAGAVIRGTMTADTLLSRRGNPKYDQDSVEAAVAASKEHFASAIGDRNARIIAINKIISAPLDPGLTPDKALTARKQRTELAAQGHQLEMANKRDNAALNKLLGVKARANAPQPVVAGTRGTVVKVGGKLVYQPH
jgi:hypothetical protein